MKEKRGKKGSKYETAYEKAVRENTRDQPTHGDDEDDQNPADMHQDVTEDDLDAMSAYERGLYETRE